MTNAEKESLIGRYLAAYNAFDIDGMLALLSPDVVFENYAGGERTAATQGVDEFRALAESSRPLFSEREQRITRVTHGQDHSLAYIAYRGKLAVDVPGGPTAGTVLELAGRSESSFADRKIRRIVDRS